LFVFTLAVEGGRTVQTLFTFPANLEGKLDEMEQEFDEILEPEELV